jgi:predicted outer membrane repeat protein
MNDDDPMVGGAIYLTGGKTYLDNVIFFRNFALAGGAIYVGPSAQLTIAGGTFLRNNATGTGTNTDSINNSTNTNPNTTNIPPVRFVLQKT